MKLSIMFYPNTEKTVKKSGKIPMYVRITLNRKKAEMQLNIEVPSENLVKWDEKTMRFADGWNGSRYATRFKTFKNLICEII